MRIYFGSHTPHHTMGSSGHSCSTVCRNTRGKNIDETNDNDVEAGNNTEGVFDNIAQQGGPTGGEGVNPTTTGNGGGGGGGGGGLGPPP